VCLRGASEVEHSVLEKTSGYDLRAYVVWLPVLRAGDVERAAHRESGRISDSRALNFFDPDARLPKLYSGILHLPRGSPAWDVYMVFAPSARWEQDAPTPTYWMHQLGRQAPVDLELDGDRLARIVGGLLTASRKGAPITAH
jgi:hypothetical protein